MLSKYRVDHKSVLVSELKSNILPITLNVFLYNDSLIRARLIFIPKEIQHTCYGYKVFAESLTTSSGVRINTSRSDYLELWDNIEGLNELIEKESLRVIALLST